MTEVNNVLQTQAPAINLQELMQQQKQLLAGAQKLQEVINQHRAQEKGVVVHKVRTMIQEYGIVPEELGFAPMGNKARKTSGAKGKAVAPKFRDPLTGATWTGRGLQPKWLQAHIAAGRNPEEFSISTDIKDAHPITGLAPFSGSASSPLEALTSGSIGMLPAATLQSMPTATV